MQVAATTGASGDWHVRVLVAEGWHVNANPASFPSLIPTRVEHEDGTLVAGARYPAGELFEPAFAPDPIAVYEGEIDIALPGVSAETPTLVVRFQACDAERCLSPGTARVRLERDVE